MEKELIISVIVPVYNGEKFVKRAADSVLCQMDGRVELVLVDDGSVDSSGAICDEYAEKHSNVTVVHKKNGGLSSARNAGIAVASGEYLCFLDADDYLDQETCSRLIQVITEHHPDMIDFGWKYVSSSGMVSTNLHSVPKEVLLDETTIRDMILPPLLNLRKDDEHFIYDYACVKAFKTSILKEYEIRFDETRRIWEDRPFCIIYLQHCKTFFSVSECFYNYVDIPNSLSRRYHLEFFDVILKNYEMYRSVYGEIYDFDTPYVNGYWAGSIENMIYRSLEEKENQDVIRGNILSTLQKEQVVHWFVCRETHDAFSAKIKEWMRTGEFEKVIDAYSKRSVHKRKEESRKKVKLRIRRSIGRLLGR